MIEVIRSGETLQMLLNCWHDFFQKPSITHTVFLNGSPDWRSTKNLQTALGFRVPALILLR